MFRDCGPAARFCRAALISIAFFQIVLTPYLFFWLRLSMAGYGRWCLLNVPISALIGPLFARTLKWMFGR